MPTCTMVFGRVTTADKGATITRQIPTPGACDLLYRAVVKTDGRSIHGTAATAAPCPFLGGWGVAVMSQSKM